MKILVVGKGGREHSFVFHLRLHNENAEIHAIPGNDGMSDDIIRVKEMSDSDVEGIVEYAKKNKIDYVFIGPEFPLSLGLADRLNKILIPTFGVFQKAAKLESSKVFAKSVMKSYNIPTASHKTFSSMEQVKIFFESEENEISFPKVIKADGLAFGKGVFIVYNKEEALKVFHDLLVEKKLKEAADLIILEDYIDGREVSAFALFDYKSFLPMAYVQDYKKLNEGEKGPNTGGMGSYMPVSLNPEIKDKINNQIFAPMLKAFQELAIPYKGILYAGLKINQDKVYVLEFNVRFGDPEAQSILPLLKNNLVDILNALNKNSLEKLELKWEKQSSVCIVLAKKGYPDQLSDKEFLIKNLNQLENQQGLYVFHAGTRKEGEDLFAVGGRVLNIVGVDETIELAKKKVYFWVSKIDFDHMHYRLDIANEVN